MSESSSIFCVSKSTSTTENRRGGDRSHQAALEKSRQKQGCSRRAPQAADGKCRGNRPNGTVHQLRWMGRTRQVGGGGGPAVLSWGVVYRSYPHLPRGSATRGTLRCDGGRHHSRSRRLQAVHPHCGERAAPHQESSIQPDRNRGLAKTLRQ